MESHDRSPEPSDVPDRVPLTVLLGRSQLLQRRIRAGQVTNVYACMETLVQVDALVGALDTLLSEADARSVSTSEDNLPDTRT